MIRHTALIALTILLWLRPSQTPIFPSPHAQACTDVHPHQPIVVYEVSGGTLAGPIDLELLVYQDGSARLSSSTANFGSGKSQNAYVGDKAASAFLTALSQNGASQLCDLSDLTSDMPLSTLSVMRGNTNARIHTFSWFFATDQHAAVEQIVQAFIASNFPNF